ncbi:MAG: MarR family transcriptional regulator [Pseudomonadota bacterium]
MTEIIENTDAPSAKLSPAVERFVLHWGDMGATWGVNRSVAQIHALLFVSGKPLHAEEISETLEMARSNVSNSLKELVGWELIKRVPVRGDRRDHYEAVGDVWEMVRTIVAMRKARELDPAAEVLKSCLNEARDDPSTSPEAVARLDDMKDMLDLFDGWYGQMKDTPKETLLPMIRMGSKVIELLRPFTRKKE